MSNQQNINFQSFITDDKFNTKNKFKKKIFYDSLKNIKENIKEKKKCF